MGNRERGVVLGCLPISGMLSISFMLIKSPHPIHPDTHYTIRLRMNKRSKGFGCKSRKNDTTILRLLFFFKSLENDNKRETTALQLAKRKRDER